MPETGEVFPLAAGISNLVGVYVWRGDPQRQKEGILSVIIYREPPPPTCSVTLRGQRNDAALDSRSSQFSEGPAPIAPNVLFYSDL